MTGRIVFLLQEPSMKTFLLAFLPRLVPEWKHGEHFLLVPHEGKSDLEKSIPRKLQAWREPGVRFVIVRDNDGADCTALKQRLQALCAHRDRTVLIRLVCQELEAWYLADPNALAAAYPSAEAAVKRLVRRFPDPDACPKPSQELARVIPEFHKNDAAYRLGQRLSTRETRSARLRAFTSGVLRYVGPSA